MLVDILWTVVDVNNCVDFVDVCRRFSVHKTRITFFGAGFLITSEHNTAHYGEFVLFEVYLVENRGQVKFSGSANYTVHIKHPTAQRRRCTLKSAQKTTENSVIITVRSLGLGLGFKVSDTQRPNCANVYRNLPKTTENSV